LILGRLVPKESKILLVGHSRGGFLSLMMAGERPTLIKGVINFAGAWHAVTDRLDATDIELRIRAQKTMLTKQAKLAKAPTMWLYAARDPNYKDGFPQELYRTWEEAGGQGEFVYFAEHSLPMPHLAYQNPGLWTRQVDAFLKRVQ
jgi:pimeloyl-ACP methyl ester carboxylesterase